MISRREGSAFWFFAIFTAVPAWLGWLNTTTPLPLLATLALAFVALSLWHARIGAGITVVRSSGARRLRPKRGGALERRLLDVVEELAVAARLPVPAVFVLDDPCINALSSCRRPTDAAIAVTRGALRQLTRAELQALVAHEVAHLVRGDARTRARFLGFRIALDDVAELFAPERRRFGFVRAVSGPVGDAVETRVSVQRDVEADAMAVALLRDPGSLVACLRKVAADPDRGRLRCDSPLRHISFAGDPTYEKPDHPDNRLETRIRALQASFGVA